MATYTILTDVREEVEKKLKRYGKKAQKYNVPFSFSFGEPYCKSVKRKNDYGFVVENKYEVCDLTINSEVIKKGNYTVIAHIDHSLSENVVDVFHGETQKKWVTLSPFCEHCNSNHNLKYTFIVTDGKEEKQVGRNCLKDYCGIDPQMIGIANEFSEELKQFSPERYNLDGISLAYDAEEVLAFAIETVREQGYRKSDEYKSNKSIVSKKIDEGHPNRLLVTEAHMMAQAIRDMSIDEAIDARLNNVKARLSGFYCKPSDFGYFAYAPVAFENWNKRKEAQKRRTEEKKAMANTSKHVGVIGERASFDIKEMRLITSYETNYGTSYLYRFIDTSDNVLIWFASSPFGEWVNGHWIEKNNVSRIKATIKDHSERDGVKQTIISRVKEF